MEVEKAKEKDAAKAEIMEREKVEEEKEKQMLAKEKETAEDAETDQSSNATDAKARAILVGNTSQVTLRAHTIIHRGERTLTTAKIETGATIVITTIETSAETMHEVIGTTVGTTAETIAATIGTMMIGGIGGRRPAPWVHPQAQTRLMLHHHSLQDLVVI